LQLQRRSKPAPDAVPVAGAEEAGEAGDDPMMMTTMQLAADSFELELAGDDLQLFNNMAAGLLGSPRFTLGAARVRVKIRVAVLVRPPRHLGRLAGAQ